MHNGLKHMRKTVLCLELIRIFSEGRTLPDLPPKGKLEEKIYRLMIAVMKLYPLPAF